MAASALYSGLGAEEPPLFFLLTSVVWLWAIGWWLTDDLRKRRYAWFYCPGLFLHVASPLVLPYYLLKTRGWRAFITIGVFFAVSIAAAVLGIVIGVTLATD